MCQIREFQLPAVVNNEHSIFDNTINSDFVIYHGTCALYDENISENGFVCGYSPFQNNEINELIALLERLGMADSTNMELSIKQRLQGYLVRRDTSPLSFTYSAMEALYYATEERKGGQIFCAVKDRVNWIENQENELSETEIILLDNLRYRIRQVLESNGCVYAINVNQELFGQLSYADAINDVSRRFYAANLNSGNIPIRLFLGRLIVPPNFICDFELIQKCSSNIMSKAASLENSLVFQLRKLKYAR